MFIQPTQSHAVTFRQVRGDLPSYTEHHRPLSPKLTKLSARQARVWATCPNSLRECGIVVSPLRVRRSDHSTTPCITGEFPPPFFSRPVLFLLFWGGVTCLTSSLRAMTLSWHHVTYKSSKLGQTDLVCGLWSLHCVSKKTSHLETLCNFVKS